MVLILVVALLVFGPKRLPDLARSLGKGMAEFRRASNDLRRTLQETERDVDAASQQPDRPGSPGTNHRIKDEDEIGIGNNRKKAEDSYC